MPTLYIPSCRKTSPFPHCWWLVFYIVPKRQNVLKFCLALVYPLRSTQGDHFFWFCHLAVLSIRCGLSCRSTNSVLLEGCCRGYLQYFWGILRLVYLSHPQYHLLRERFCEENRNPRSRGFLQDTVDHSALVRTARVKTTYCPKVYVCVHVTDRTRRGEEMNHSGLDHTEVTRKLTQRTSLSQKGVDGLITTFQCRNMTKKGQKCRLHVPKGISGSDLITPRNLPQSVYTQRNFSDRKKDLPKDTPHQQCGIR